MLQTSREMAQGLEPFIVSSNGSCAFILTQFRTENRFPLFLELL
jgi:hypothetical protein